MTASSKILVTGAGGLIGSATIHHLFKNGYEVSGVYKTKPVTALPWPVIIADLENEPPASFLNNTKPRAIVHCAAKLPKDRSECSSAFKINKKIDEHILDYISGNIPIKLIYISGTSIYGTTDAVCYEHSQINPPNQYLEGKALTERAILNSVINGIILRVSSPYSPFQKNHTVLKLFIEKAVANMPLIYHGSGKREQDFISVQDVSSAILNSVTTKDVKGIFNICSGKSISMKELARLVVNTVPDCRSSVSASGSADEQENYKPDISIEKAKKILHWEPSVSLKQGIKNWVDHLLNENSHSF